MTCWEIARQMLEIGENLATIATGAVAVFVSLRFHSLAADRKARLETYLREARVSDATQGRHGMRVPMHLAAALSMTLSDVWNAAVDNPKIRKIPIVGQRGFAVGVKFQYDDAP